MAGVDGGTDIMRDSIEGDEGVGEEVINSSALPSPPHSPSSPDTPRDGTPQGPSLLFKYLDVDPNGLELPDDLKDNDLCETATLRFSKLEELRRRIQALPEEDQRIKDLSDENLIRFLRGKKFRVEDALQTTINFALFYKEHYKLFEGNNIADFRVFGKLITVLPHRDHNGKVVILFRPVNCIEYFSPQFLADNPSILVRAMLWFFNLLNKNVYIQVCGAVLIVSFGDLSLWNSMAISQALWEVHNVAFRFLTKCTATRVGGIYLFEQPSVLTWAFNIVYLFLNKKLRERFHLCGENVEMGMDIFSGVSPSDVPTCIGGTKEDDYDESMFWILREVQKCCANGGDLKQTEEKV